MSKPNTALGRGASGIVIKRGGAFVEAAGMPGIRKLEMLKVEVVAVFMAQRAEKGSERSDVFLHRGTHPHADGQGGRIVVSKKFTRPVLANAESARCQHADIACGLLIKARQQFEKLLTAHANLLRFAGFHSGFDGLRESQQSRTW